MQLHLTEPAIQPPLRMMGQIESFHFAHKIIGPKLYQIESNSPP